MPLNPGPARGGVRPQCFTAGLKLRDSVTMISLSKLKPEIERVCRTMPVRRLGIFGSAVTKDFGPASDVDVLVVFETAHNVDLFATYFELKERLEEIFERQVDLTVDKPFKNPIFRNSVEKTRIVVYERRDSQEPY